MCTVVLRMGARVVRTGTCEEEEEEEEGKRGEAKHLAAHTTSSDQKQPEEQVILKIRSLRSSGRLPP